MFYLEQSSLLFSLERIFCYSTALKATDKFDLKALKSLKLVKTLAKLGKLKYQSHPDN